MQATGSENSDVIQKHPQNLPSEDKAAKTRQEKEGSGLQGTVQGLLCIHWRDRKNLEEADQSAQDMYSSEEE